jgi:hypothetical protein
LAQMRGRLEALKNWKPSYEIYLSRLRTK